MPAVEIRPRPSSPGIADNERTKYDDLARRGNCGMRKDEGGRENFAYSVGESEIVTRDRVVLKTVARPTMGI